jgi:hypothetical protein
MRPSEINALIAWMMAAFPNWNVDATTTATWAAELPDVLGSEAINAVRRIRRATPSPFPPNVFEILAELDPTPPAKFKAREAFRELVEHVRRRGADAGLPEDFGESGAKAVSMIGGLREIGRSSDADLVFLEHRFVDSYETLKKREDADGHDKRIAGTGEQRQIGNSPRLLTGA